MPKNKKQNSLHVFAGLFILFTCCFAAVLFRIVYLQYIDRQEWIDVENELTSDVESIPATRGNIYDCNGKLLSGSLPRYVVFIDARTQALHRHHDSVFTNVVDTIAIGLADIIGDRTAAEYSHYLRREFSKQNKRILLSKRPISHTQLLALRKLPLLSYKNPIKGGFYVEDRHERVKPFGTLASRTLGSVDKGTGHGIVGLERRFDADLCGKPGKGQKRRVDGAQQMTTIIEPEDGRDVITTIDAELQDIVETALRRQLERCNGNWGCAILMETKTGAIKAISNLNRSDSTYVETENHAVTRVDPGSTFKTVSLMACLENGKVQMTDTFGVSTHGWNYYGHPVFDDAGHAKDTVLQVLGAMACSSNIAFAKMVTRGYKGEAKGFIRQIQRMGLSDSVYSEIPGFQNPLITEPKAGDAVTLSRMAYGYSVEFTPLQTLMFYNAIANDGKMIRPYLVSAIRDKGTTVKQFHTETIKSQICSGNTLRLVKNALHEVVWNEHLGTAVAARSKMVNIAGKTGTAQVRINGKYSHDLHRMSFVGYFPEEAPEYTCYFVMESLHGGSGLSAAGVRQIAEKTMAYCWTRSSTDLSLPYDSIEKPTIKGGLQKHIRKAAKGAGVKVQKTDSNWARVNREMQAISLTVQKDKVPNVVGMGARDAVYAIELTGMRAVLRGKGRVVSQSVAPGSPAQKGQTITIQLQ